MEVASRLEIPLLGDITTSRQGLMAVFEFEQACRAHHDTDVFVHTNRLRWFDANLSAVLGACFYRLQRTNGLRFIFDRAEIATRFSILARNGFVSTEGLDFTDGSGSTVRLQAFHAEHDEAFIEYIENKLLDHHGLRAHANRRSDMTRSFVEMFTNVNLHANTTDPLFACGQYYLRQNKLCFSLVDIGDGYLPAIQKHQPHLTTAALAIPWAAGPGHTTRTAEPGYFGTAGGNGLPDLVDYCKSVRGELQIVSGDAFWSSHRPGECQPIAFFSGTIVNISLPCT